MSQTPPEMPADRPPVWTMETIQTLTVVPADKTLLINGVPIMVDDFPANLNTDFNALQWYGSIQAGQIEPARTAADQLQLQELAERVFRLGTKAPRNAVEELNAKNNAMRPLTIEAADFPAKCQPWVDFYNATTQGRWEALWEEYENQLHEYNSPDAERERVKAIKNLLLRESDFLMLPDVPITDEDKTAAWEFRANLRINYQTFRNSKGKSVMQWPQLVITTPQDDPDDPFFSSIKLLSAVRALDVQPQPPTVGMVYGAGVSMPVMQTLTTGIA